MEYLTPKEAARAQCVQYLGLSQFSTKEIKNCQGDRAFLGPCPLFPYRLGGRVTVKALRKFCLQCQGSSFLAVEECETEDCPLHRYRMGKNPAMAGKRGSTEHLKTWRKRGDSRQKNFKERF